MNTQCSLSVTRLLDAAVQFQMNDLTVYFWSIKARLFTFCPLLRVLFKITVKWHYLLFSCTSPNSDSCLRL